MYSVFLSRIESVFDYIENDLNKIIKPSFKIAVLPWAFSVEINL